MICPWCEDEALLEVLEYWPDSRAFALNACCEAAHDLAVDDMQEWTRKDWQRFLGDSGVYARQVLGDDLGTFAVDSGLEVVPIEQQHARAFIAEHHRHNRPPAGWKFGAGLRSGQELVGVIWAGRPVSRVLQAQGYLEINRLCIKQMQPHGLAWNGCSTLYGWACREAARLGYQRVITYTLESEAGTSLRAAGFQAVATTKGGSWDTPSRRRTDTAPTCRKVRWERQV